MGKRVSPEDWTAAEALYAKGLTFREIRAALGERISVSTMSVRARDKGWVRGVLPANMVTPETPQVYESANATADEVSANTDKLQEAVRRRWVDHKAELADKFGEKIAILLDRAFSPYVVQEVKLVGQGEGRQLPTLTQVPLDMPPPADQVKIMTSLAILVDKASLLSGDATSRVETASLNKAQLVDRLAHIKDEVGAARERAEAARAEAAAKGATG